MAGIRELVVGSGTKNVPTAFTEPLRSNTILESKGPPVNPVGTWPVIVAVWSPEIEIASPFIASSAVYEKGLALRVGR